MLAVLAPLLFYAPTAWAENNTYKIAGEWALPPFSYTKGDGKLTGISIDIMQKVATENGLTFEYVPMSKSEAQKALENGTADAIAGIAYSTENDSRFDFSDPFFTMSDSLIIPKDKKSRIKGIDDVRNLQVAVENRTPVVDTLLNMRNTKLTLSTNQFSGLLALINGRAGVFIGNKWTAKVYLQQLNQQENFVILDEVIEPADYTIAVKEGNDKLLRMINHTLTNLKAQGEVNTVINKWVLTKPDAIIARLEHFILLLTIVLSTVALVLLFIYIWNHRLKKAVNLQTRTLRRLNENLQEQRQEIADSYAFKELILNNIDTGIVTFAPDFTITSCNARAMEMLNLSTNTPLHLQKPPLLEQMSHSSEHDSEGPNILEINEKGYRKVFFYRMMKMYDSQRMQTGYLLSINDETEKKKLEQKLITQEKLHALGQLVAGVAHEIRNPLTAIKTFIDLLPRKYDRPQFRELMMEHVPAEVNRLEMIVSDLVDYARPRPPNKQQCTANDLTSLLAFLQVTFEKKQITVNQSLNDQLIFYIDPQQIRQVLLNLILNAIDAVEETPEKNLTITIEKENEHSGRIMIADSGKGMKQDELNRIFEPFYTSKEKGVGLGLALSYQLIKENDGDIQVNSQYKKGTIFTVTLPLYEKEEIADEAACTSH
ncbi:transporter substrate-binding domain-containing protein [Neobacillus pocheonensis]|uniref:transporter substrate-binding domain-containing protein n=1 Tax=Neobacillus pocheonensis TaxID=363869 RepID=UPI003D2DE15E